MTTPVNRIVGFSIGRISADGSDIDTGVFGDEMYGKARNPRGGHVMHGINRGVGIIGPENYRNFRIGLSEEYAIDVNQARLNLDSLGPGPLYFQEFTDSFVAPMGGMDESALAHSRRWGFYPKDFSLDNEGYDLEGEVWYTLTFAPFLRVDGGGADLLDLSKTGASLYLDTVTGEYFTRAGGTGPSIDHFEARRERHGV